MRSLWMNIRDDEYLLGQCFWSAPRVWIMVRGGETGTAVSSDHWWPWAWCLHPHYAAPGQSWPLQTFTADTRCETGDTRETWDQDQIFVNSWEPLARRQQSARAIAGKWPAVVATLPHFAGDCQSLEHCGRSRHRVSCERKIAPILLILCTGLNIEHFACFVCWFAQQTKMWLGAKIDLLKLDCQPWQAEGAMELPPGVKKPEQRVQNID